MSKAVPHFSEEWLKDYNRRLYGPDKTEGKDQQKPAARKSAPTSRKEPARARPDDTGTITQYAPTESVAVPFRAYDGKQTKTEQRYNKTVLLGRGRFEAVCLYLPGGGRYTPDFMTVDDGRITFHEVKGSYRLQSQGRALTAFQEAAAAFPCFTFVWATETKSVGVFEIKRIEPVAMGEGTIG